MLQKNILWWLSVPLKGLIGRGPVPIEKGLRLRVPGKSCNLDSNFNGYW